MSKNTPESNSRSILVVDDNAGIRALISRLIAPLVDVHECADGDQAVAMYDALRPDGVLMDIRMGATDGIEATRRIRRIAPGACVIMVTGVRDRSVLQAARLAGACDVVSKENLLTIPLLLNTLFNEQTELDDTAEAP